SPKVACVNRKEALRGFNYLGLISGLLIGCHQQLNGGNFHYAVGILGEKGFQSADLSVVILLLDGADVGIVFGGILDLRGRGLSRRLLRCSTLCRRGLRL